MKIKYILLFLLLISFGSAALTGDIYVIGSDPSLANGTDISGNVFVHNPIYSSEVSNVTITEEEEAPGGGGGAAGITTEVIEEIDKRFALADIKLTKTVFYSSLLLIFFVIIISYLTNDSFKKSVNKRFSVFSGKLAKGKKDHFGLLFSKKKKKS